LVVLQKDIPQDFMKLLKLEGAGKRQKAKNRVR
jgi:hypothetical protein